MNWFVVAQKEFTSYVLIVVVIFVDNQCILVSRCNSVSICGLLSI